MVKLICIETNEAHCIGPFGPGEAMGNGIEAIINNIYYGSTSINSLGESNFYYTCSEIYEGSAHRHDSFMGLFKKEYFKILEDYGKNI